MRINLPLTFIALVIFTGTTYAYDATQIQKEMQFLSEQLYKDNIVENTKTTEEEKLADKTSENDFKLRRKKMLEDLNKDKTEHTEHNDSVASQIINLEERYFSDEISTKASSTQKTVPTPKPLTDQLHHRELNK